MIWRSQRSGEGSVEGGRVERGASVEVVKMIDKRVNAAEIAGQQTSLREKTD